MAEVLTTKKRERAAVRRAITSLVTKSETQKVDLGTVADKEQRLFVLDGEIKDLMLLESGVTEETWDEELDKVEHYRDLIVELKSSSNVHGNSKDAKCSPAKTSAVKRNFKLPKLEWEVFAGDIQNWVKFWGQFSKVDSDISIPDEDKYLYLLQATQGKARRIVEAYPPSAGNYEKAVLALKQRCGREDMLTEFYVRNLIDLVKQTSNRSMELSHLYDKLLANVNNLNSLGLTTDKFSCVIRPLVESTLPVKLLKEWEKFRVRRENCDSDSGAGSVYGSCVDMSEEISGIDDLLHFLKLEVEAEEKVKLANSDMEKLSLQDDSVETARDLHNQGKAVPTRKCLFCDGGLHASQDCGEAQKKSLDERKQLVSNKRACFQCLKSQPFHLAKDCRTFVKCLFCERRHYPILCPDLYREKCKNNSSKQYKAEHIRSMKQNTPEQDFVGINVARTVYLQTLLVEVANENAVVRLRCLLDSGSSHSYISNKAVKALNLTPVEKRSMVHCLFGGTVSEKSNHPVYIVKVNKIGDSSSLFDLTLLGQEEICKNIHGVTDPKVRVILKQEGVLLNDPGTADISILLGADILGSILTGQVKQIGALTAIQTKFGWTVLGAPPGSKSNTGLSCISLLNKTMLKNFWDLELFGVKARVQGDDDGHQLLASFKKMVRKNYEGRYEMGFPWRPEEKALLLPNFNSAKRRLENMSSKLIRDGRFDDYNSILKDWEREGVISKTDLINEGHFLPHRPVYKESSETTKIRPVFDASCKGLNGIALNDAVNKGPNLIENIPEVLLNFRKGRIGCTSDVKKAFLQLSLASEERKYFKFLWWENYGQRQMSCFEHCRVVFGVKSSPFLLSATIIHHLENSNGKYKDTTEKLKHSFYVDNCVASVENEEILADFMKESNEIMAEGKFELQAWTHSKVANHSGNNSCCQRPRRVLVLGLTWDTEKDTLSVSDKIMKTKGEFVTKRDVLSAVQSIYDPIGFTCPVTIRPKEILQECWKADLNWDLPLPSNLQEQYSKWHKSLWALSKCEISRFCLQVDCKLENCMIHVFVDGSKHAYAACIFVRTNVGGEIKVQLLAAKTRITPIKEVTIPRIELLAATLGVRLYQSHIAPDPFFGKAPVMFWTDSEVVLCWLRDDKVRRQFVARRIKEILEVSTKDTWRHCPGKSNPCDLLSRGCNADELLHHQWWQGPLWLQDQEDKWPKGMESTLASSQEEEILSLCQANVTTENSVLATLEEYNYSTLEAARVLAYALRFLKGKRMMKAGISQEITGEEMEKAELIIWRLTQEKYFTPNTVKNLLIVKDNTGIMRATSRLTLGEDGEDYKYPILLPNKSPLVRSLIVDTHKLYKHAGAATVMTLLREKYWVIKGRKTVKEIIRKCIICQRFNAVKIVTASAPLPMARVKAQAAFEQTGIDCLGPLYARETKVWVVIFTCAVFRAIHLEVIESMSTDCFILALRRFIARRGRMMRRIICDNGSNFTGCRNELESLNWDEITRETTCHKITWQFNVAGAPWWGGFWERMVRVVKDILRKNLGRSNVTLEELTTLVIECEKVVNERPLTYIYEGENLAPLTPLMFLNNIFNTSTDDLDEISRSKLTEKFRSAQSVRDVIRTRFEKEYLGALMAHANTRGVGRRRVKVGDIVIVEYDNKKRIHWPLGRILEVFPGSDGQERAARIKIAGGGEISRPLQRIYPLEVDINTDENDEETLPVEVSADENDEETLQTEVSADAGKDAEDRSQNKVVKTKRGRAIHKPNRYLD